LADISAIVLLFLGSNPARQEKTFTRVAAMVAIFIHISFAASVLTYFAVTESSVMSFIVVSSAFSAVSFLSLSRLLMRAEPTRLTPMQLFRCLKRIKLHTKEYIILFSIILVMICLTVILIKLLILYFGPDIAPVAFFAFGFGMSALGVFIKFRERRKAVKHLNNIIKESADLPVLEYIKLAGSAEELLVWLRGKGKEWLNDNATVRSVLRYAEVKFEVLHEASQEEDEVRSEISIRALGAFILVELERESPTTP
jgi:hypothetical protein